MAIRTVIIEDEPAIARRLEQLILKVDQDIEVIQKLAGVAEATEWLKEHRQSCDLLFMDIRLNDGLSFKIFDQITTSIPVIFVTGYDEFALEDFKVNGIDYILKPFHEDQIRATLSKYKSLVKSEQSNFRSQLDRVLQDLQQARSAYKNSFLVHHQDKLIPLKVEAICWFYTAQELVYAYTNNGQRYIIESSLERLEEELEPQKFFRANRQFIVNREAIENVDFYFNGRLLININPRPTEKILVSKAKAPQFKSWLAN